MLLPGPGFELHPNSWGWVCSSGSKEAGRSHHFSHHLSCLENCGVGQGLSSLIGELLFLMGAGDSAPSSYPSPPVFQILPWAFRNCWCFDMNSRFQISVGNSEHAPLFKKTEPFTASKPVLPGGYHSAT